MIKGKLKIDDLKIRFNKVSFSHNELYEFYLEDEPDLKSGTFRWRVYELKKLGIIRSLKRGIYILEKRKEFDPTPSLRIKRLYNLVKNRYPYINISIWETKWLHDFMVHQPGSSSVIIDVDREVTESVFSFLKESKENIFLKPSLSEVERYVLTVDNSIIVKNLIVDSPVKTHENIHIPKIEKILVDIFIESGLFLSFRGQEMINIFENAFMEYSINLSTLYRYAQKRKVKAKLLEFLNNQTNIEKFYLG